MYKRQGVTNHFSRIFVEDPVALNNEDFIAGTTAIAENTICLLYTSDAADERSSVDLGGRRIIKKKTNK